MANVAQLAADALTEGGGILDRHTLCRGFGPDAQPDALVVGDHKK